MTVNEEKIIVFEKSVKKDVDTEVRDVIDNARREKNELIKSKHDEMILYSFRKITAESKMIRMRHAKNVSQTGFDAKRAVLQTRSNLTDEFFEKIKEKLFNFCEKPEYHDFLLGLTANIEKKMPFYDGVTIFLKPGDNSELILKKYPRLKIESLKSIKIGGIVFYYPNEQKYIDETLDKRMETEKAKFGTHYELQLI
ncbi:MAG: hypothetical protein LBR74_07365 [Eubacterium sp.]|jgi:vacuolar-type H+-ATPase subunit E/Vma4|nr:hypothetical protein [Eubacterium sp.]